MADLRPILLVEDSPKDLELTLAALEKCQLANEIIDAQVREIGEMKGLVADIEAHGDAPGALEPVR